jgi:hypothetical protein
LFSGPFRERESADLDKAETRPFKLPMPWSRKLFPRIALDDGRVFTTLKDAADYVLALSEIRRSSSPHHSNTAPH